MEHHSTQQDIRTQKLEKLREMGINPYPYSFEFTHQSGAVLEKGDALIEAGQEIALAGRLVALRKMGKAAFAHIKDNHHRLQLYLRKDALSEAEHALSELLDLGDYIGVRGTLFRTKTGELTLRAAALVLLAKAVRPMPVPKVEQRDGEQIVHDEVRDLEFRYRQRYVDLALNEDVAQVFLNRSRIVQTLRDYMLEQGFLEVETPILQVMYGGAAAKPFTTRHEALGVPLFLRIATELYLKRLVVGGFDRVFEIGKDFRNEGVDRSHNPEFTMVEFYQAYADYTDMMAHFETIYERCALAIHGTTELVYQGHRIDVKRPWRRLKMVDAIQEYGGLDFPALDDGAVQALLTEKGWELEGPYSRGLAMARIFEETCEQHLIQPVFILDHPVETTPFAKEHRDPREVGMVERFEPYMAGFELGNAYSELNDPKVQQALFGEQQERRKSGDLEAHPYDADFIRAMEYGMPPTGGVGLGVDRMVMLILDQPSIRDVLLFPTMKLEAGQEG